MTTLLDDDNPWPGLDSFEEGSHRYFNGRDDEIEALAARIDAASVIVLFGKSGLGKTSLLRAGLMPRMRERGLLPVYIRLALRPGAPAPAVQLADALRDAIAVEGIDAPAMGDESLWRYLHRSGLEFWDARNFPCTPVFVLDQFEEVFTVADSIPEMVARWRIDLGDLAENRIPSGQEPTPELQLREMRCKFLLSLREDFLPELEGWRGAIPSLGKSRMRLHAMGTRQARQAIQKSAPHLMDEAMACRIIEFVAAAQVEPTAVAQEGDSRTAEVEPALLSLFCHGLNQKRQFQGKAHFDDALLDDAKQAILSDYYRDCFAGMPDSVSRFVATELITEKGYRNSVSKDDATPAHLSEEHLSVLIHRRLLRLEERYGSQRIELTHDLLTRVVREHRERLRREDDAIAAAARLEEDRRILEEEFSKKRVTAEHERLTARLRANRITGLVGAVVLVVLGCSNWISYRQGKEATSREQVAQDETAAAAAARDKAGARLKWLETSVAMRQAITSGDDKLINKYLGEKIDLSVGAEAIPDGSGAFRFKLLPNTTDDYLREHVAMITYRVGDELIPVTKLPKQSFIARFTGEKCPDRVIILVEYVDTRFIAKMTAFNMCEVLAKKAQPLR